MGNALRGLRSSAAAEPPPAAAASAAGAPVAGDPDLERTLSDGERALLARCRPHTMTSAARLLALADSVRYVVTRGIPGAFVECGVWRGGSVLAMILTLQELGASDRDIHLFDTFEGMTEPTEHDTSPFHEPALQSWEQAKQSDTRAWESLFAEEIFNLDTVRATLTKSGYPAERLHFHQGDVLQTIPGGAPADIALLRLDTDWYESTRHELEHLYPRLARGGVLIIDDYGHWEGARRAVDEYFGERPPLLHRIDYTARATVKE